MENVMSVDELRLKEIESLLYTMTRKVSSFCSSTYKKLSISYRQKRVMSIFRSTVVKTLFLNCCTKFIGFCFHFFSTCVIIYFKLRSLDRRSNEETSSSLCFFMYFFCNLQHIRIFLQLCPRQTCKEKNQYLHRIRSPVFLVMMIFYYLLKQIR